LGYHRVIRLGAEPFAGPYVELSDPSPSSKLHSPFADLFRCHWVQSKYIDAPLLPQRSEYVSYLLAEGVPRARIKSIASMQLNAVKLLNITQMRPILVSEVQEAGFLWATDVSLRNGKRVGKASCYNFTHRVTQWLEFSDSLVKPELPRLPLHFVVNAYLEECRANGLSKSTIDLRLGQLSRFQVWLGRRDANAAAVSLNDIDEYLDSKRRKGLDQRTLRNVCGAIRMLLRFCESRGWCKAGLARGMLMPRVLKSQKGPRGPTWKDVRRMLRVRASSPIEMRANVIICLSAIYALRNSEISHLRLDDFDWYNEIVTVRRAKRGGIQQFPIQHEVGEAILAYLRSARPRSTCRSMLTTFQAPFRQMGATCIQKTVANRMRTLGIRSEKSGPHALRHSCATHLLNRGFSLPEIADYLGHRGLHSVSIYAKYDPRLLRRVASFNLQGIE